MPLTGDPWLATNPDGSVPAVRAAAPVAVFRYDGTSALTLLPNVECLAIDEREGTDPGSARFRYNLASGLPGAPISIETALGTQFSGTYIVNSGDRLVVQGQRPDGSTENLFDGLAIDFGMGLEPDFEEVIIGAVGIGWHAWDTPIGGTLMRHSGSARVVEDLQTDLPAQFNPKGKPNCTPDGYMSGSASGQGDFRYPTFLDPLVLQKKGDGTPDDTRTYWTLAKALRYLLFNYNLDPDPTKRYVSNPDGGFLDNLLVSPSTGGDTSVPIRCSDTPITGKDWPGTVNRIVSESGFGTAFILSTDGSGLPTTAFQVFQNQAGSVKQLYLYPPGTPFDARLFNVNASSLHRDLSDVVNQVTVVGDLHRWEASFVLQCGFPMQSSDALVGNLPTFDKNDPAYIATNRDKYRLYILDETSDGHYAPGTNTLIPLAPPLDSLFGKDPNTGKKLYTRRRRPGIGTLISVDGNNKPFPARLAISTNYAGPSPGVWDGTGTWQTITSTTWRILDDRLGVEITDSNPNKWDIGESRQASVPYPAGVVNAVEKQATTVAGQNFTLRLTCVVEADKALSQTAQPRGGSPLTQTIARTVDASDRYHNEYVHYPSEFNNSGNSDLNPRDDTKPALAEAQAVRASLEAGVFGGPVVIPRLTTYYGIGDLISQIEGRNLGLRTDQGSETPVYPVVVGRRFEFGPEIQTTTLELSDAGTHRDRYARPPGRRGKGYSTNRRHAEMPDEPDTNAPMEASGGGGLGGPAAPGSAPGRYIGGLGGGY